MVNTMNPNKCFFKELYSESSSFINIEIASFPLLCCFPQANAVLGLFCGDLVLGKKLMKIHDLLRESMKANLAGVMITLSVPAVLSSLVHVL